jgi:anti-sigma regulatory factor (Ser/Thr protein kinase)
MPTASLRLAPTPESVGAARRMLRETLSTWGLPVLEYAAAQALTEIATNAVIHARTAFNVTLQWADDVLKVCVEDESPRLPVQRSYAVDATTGRGLSLVDRLCRSWGVQRTETGKQVWFEVSADEISVDPPAEVGADELMERFDHDVAANGTRGAAQLAA